MAGVRLHQVRKVFDNGQVAVAGASFEVADGELVALVGPSGCGKSTLLRMIAGLETVTSGTLHIGERLVNEVPPRDRDIAMVFQSYALYPHMSVRDNLAFGLRLRGVNPSSIDAQPQAKGKVFTHAHVRVERIALEHHGDVAIAGRHFVDQPLANVQRATGDGLEAGDHAQQR